MWSCRVRWWQGGYSCLKDLTIHNSWTAQQIICFAILCTLDSKQVINRAWTDTKFKCLCHVWISLLLINVMDIRTYNSRQYYLKTVWSFCEHLLLLPYQAVLFITLKQATGLAWFIVLITLVDNASEHFNRIRQYYNAFLKVTSNLQLNN